MRRTITMTIWTGKETWSFGITRQGVSREENERGAQCPPSLGAWDGGGEAGVPLSGTIRVMSFRQAIDVSSEPCLLNPSWTIFSVTSHILLVGNGPITWMRGLPSIIDNLNLTTSQLSDDSCAASCRGEIETTNAVSIRATTQGVSPFRMSALSWGDVTSVLALFHGRNRRTYLRHSPIAGRVRFVMFVRGCPAVVYRYFSGSSGRP